MVINLWPTFLAHPVYSFTRQRLQRNAILKRRNINIATIYITVTTFSNFTVNQYQQNDRSYAYAAQRSHGQENAFALDSINVQLVADGAKLAC